MNYITSRRGDTLSNEPYEISYDDIRKMYFENIKDAEECKRVTESSMRGESYYYGDGRPGTEKTKDFNAALFKEILYRDAKTSGFMMEYPHGKVIKQAERNSYYRGENQIYLKSQATLYRSLELFQDEESRQLYRMITDMKIAEFGIFLLRIDFVQFWLHQKYSDVLFEPLAQHYGFETEWLDITNDFNVALFFATCKWDNGSWHPLTKQDTEKNEQTKYGVLFHIPGWRANEQRMFDGLETIDGKRHMENVILPIGFQPFMRCHSQYAYGIQMKEPYPLQNDISFEKLHFRHSEKLSRDVYELMDGGKKIYPQEGLDDFQDVLNDIRTATSFSEEAFRYAFEKNSYFGDEEKIKRLLKEKIVVGSPIIIESDKHPFHVSRQRLRHLCLKYEGFTLEKNYGIRQFTRMVLKPPK